MQAEKKIPEIRERFSIELRNRFSALPDEQDVENHRVKSKSIYNETGKKIIGPRKKTGVDKRKELETCGRKENIEIQNRWHKI